MRHTGDSREDTVHAIRRAVGKNAYDGGDRLNKDDLAQIAEAVDADLAGISANERTAAAFRASIAVAVGIAGVGTTAEDYQRQFRVMELRRIADAVVDDDEADEAAGVEQ